MMMLLVRSTRTATTFEWFVFWLAFTGIMIFMTIFIMKRRRRNRKRALAEKIKMEEIKQQFSVITSDNFDDIPDDKLYEVLTARLEQKDIDDEDYIYNMTEAEQTLYAVYLMNESVSATHGIRSFFGSPSTEPFVPIIGDIYRRFGAMDIADLLESAYKLFNVLENGAEDDDESEYSRYNFSDYTHEYVTRVVGTDFNTKLNRYVREHKEEFFDVMEEKTDEETVSE